MPLPGAEQLLARFWAKVQIPRHPNGAPDYDQCWPWLAAKSQSGRRGVFYGILRIAVRKGWYTVLRVNRLALLIHAGTDSIPELAPFPDETYAAWLYRANGFYKHREASHLCDRSICANPEHLTWESHGENIENARLRREQAREQKANPISIIDEVDEPAAISASDEAAAALPGPPSGPPRDTTPPLPTVRL